jgi:hypothetical protein
MPFFYEHLPKNIIVMEEAIIKLIKVTAFHMKGLYQFGSNAECVVSDILADASLAVHPEAREELNNYFSQLN